MPANAQTPARLHGSEQCPPWRGAAGFFVFHKVGQWTTSIVQRPTSAIEIIELLSGWPKRRLFLLGPEAGDAFSSPNHARCRHLGSGYFLDLAGGTGSIIDLDTLSELQIDDILLARQRLRRHCRGKRKQCEKRYEGGKKAESPWRSTRAERLDSESYIAIGRHQGCPLPVKFSSQCIETAPILKAVSRSSANSTRQFKTSLAAFQASVEWGSAGVLKNDAT
jgi:hypothetical protein